MPSVVRITAQGKVEDLDGKEAAKHGYLAHLDAMVVLIQDLIPLGLQAFAEVLQARKDAKERNGMVCPHCGRIINETLVKSVCTGHEEEQKK